MVCYSCKYFGFRGLKKWCRHPDYNKELPKERSKCGKWLDVDKMDISPEKRTFVDPLTQAT